MAINRFFALKLNYRKGRSFLLLPFFMFAISCYSVISSDGKVMLHNNSSKDSFVFSVSDEFIKSNLNSPKSKKNPKMTESEEVLLSKLLRQKRYCLNNYGLPLFHITSRQEKVYDMTFAHLIEQNYNARAVAPRMYFGRCSKE